MLTQEQIRLAEEATEELLAEGRPHGSNPTYPDGCECERCEEWDKLKRFSDARTLERTAAAHEQREAEEQNQIEQARHEGKY